jgi:hypothetical protein
MTAMGTRLGACALAAVALGTAAGCTDGGGGRDRDRRDHVERIEGQRERCLEAAESRGWRVRDTDQPKRFGNLGEGEWLVPMRVRGRDGDSFDVVCRVDDRGRVRLQDRD